MVKSDGEVVYNDKLPEFFKVYVPALCSQIMRIPPDFIEKLGENIPRMVTLRREICGKVIRWKVDMKRNMNGDLYFDKGWTQFVKENRVEDGDFLTFSYAANSMFFVKVFARNGCRKRVDTTTTTTIHAQIPQLGLQSSHQPPQNSKGNGGVVMRDVRRRESSNPCLSVRLTKYYKHKGVLHIPMKFWKEYMRKHDDEERVINGSRMVSLGVKNKLWEVKLMAAEDRVLLTKGWPKFMKDNCMGAGNLCTFELIDTTHFLFNVTINN